MAAAISSDLRPFLPKTVKFANDWGKGVSSHCRRAGAEIAFLNEFVRDIVVCLIIPGTLLLRQILDPLRWFFVFLALLGHILVARATRPRHFVPCSALLTIECMHRSYAYACMHAQQSVDRTSPSVRVSDSFVNLDSFVVFSFSLECGYVILGLFFPSPTRFQPDKYANDA